MEEELRALLGREVDLVLPWRQIIGKRNRIIHGYGNVKLNVVWDIAAAKAAILIEHLEPSMPATPE